MPATFTPPAPTGARTPFGSPRVLVVDDEPHIRAFLAAALQEEGYDVRTAADGLDALEVLRRWPADVVLLDLVLPRMHGFDVARACRRGTGGRRPPRVVAMTAAGPAAARAARALGAADVLPKPLDLGHVLRVLDALTALTHTHRHRSAA